MNSILILMTLTWVLFDGVLAYLLAKIQKKLYFEISQKIETEMICPDLVKVRVIRETSTVTFAK